ncbi:DNA-binding response regulator, NarL/FixJ family, contains REC and HTH domains [Roseovarius nanhaiticus]|uniref:DNA-binding response regulator, NarL/FixJ family, contains REC and HTH domains n=1 Tax=Roseovarius nanhaiticus TaxID=573024 RepID=A0A1N7FUP2_9RHOB|nr:response regulator transcription factor [Roseovarius nanhaiticus]SEK44929.1 DNA-binding response regulator, NarL/FixJ family, contains REC and HTH domains [Roseovarius nanhaiticus]SIS04060.1 DNA-binding response regulator, NarL/FixJ family, contains REC and HTH domains [Roseovarius nanhaiticus]
MSNFDKKTVGILGGCFLVRSALELILAELKLDYVAADDPGNVPPDVGVVLLSYTTNEALTECIAACMDRAEPPRIVLFPQDASLLESVRGLPADVAAVVPPTLAAPEIRSVISLVVEGHRILPFALSDGHRVSGAGRPDRIRPGLLTERQLEILREVAKGQSNKAIARSLSISINTVEAHVSRIIRKLQVDNRTQAALALREGVPSSKPSVSAHGVAAAQA